MIIEDRKLYGKNWRFNNEDKVKQAIVNQNCVRKNRLKTDLVFKLKRNCSNNIRKLINSIRTNTDRQSKIFLILKCDYLGFKNYIESKFEPWMNWENYGKYNGELNYGWDIDHIEPLSNAVTESDVILLNHHINLQPLCSYTNRHIKKEPSAL